MSESRSDLDLAALRREYGEHGLDTPDLEPDPLAMFRRWLDDAVRAPLHEPNAMVVTTVSAEGSPSARMVLLKGLDEGFVFYTNYDSRKGREIEAIRRSRCSSRGTTCSARSASRAPRRGSPPRRARPTSPPGPGSRRSAPGPLPSPRPVHSRDELDELYAAAQQRFADAERDPRADTVGRPPGPARGRRVLAGPQGADARPAGLPPGGRGLGNFPARPIANFIDIVCE